MILREYTAVDTCNKNRLYVEVACDNCSTTYTRQKRQLKEPYACCGNCLSHLTGSRVFVECAHCNAKVSKKRSALANSKSGLYFCNRACKEAAQSYMVEIMPDHYGTCETNYRKKALEFYGATCNRCGYDANIAAIEVHHKNRNRSDNNLDNLEVLCANCHSIEHRR